MRELWRFQGQWLNWNVGESHRQLTDNPADASPDISKKIPAGILIGPTGM